MKAVTWDINAIRKFDMHLSDSLPIKGIVVAYAQNKSAVFDMHYELELGIVCKGRMRRFYRDYECDMGAGQLWLCGIWEPHGFEILSPSCEAVILAVWPPMLARLRFDEDPAVHWLSLFKVPPPQRPKLSVQDRRQMLELGERLKQTIRNRSSNDRLWLRVLLMEVLLVLHKQGRIADVSRSRDAGDSFDRINPALHSIFENKRFLTTQEAARTCGLNRNGFSRLFKTSMGISFSDFSMMYRLNTASKRLSGTREPVKTIALDCGFTDASHFYRLFLRHFECTPSEYRQRIGLV